MLPAEICIRGHAKLRSQMMGICIYSICCDCRPPEAAEFALASHAVSRNMQRGACKAPQSDDGYLYPLERAFFYVHKPPTLLVHDEIESIEFMRQGGGVLAASAKTFDLLIRMRNSSARPRPLAPCESALWGPPPGRLTSSFSVCGHDPPFRRNPTRPAVCTSSDWYINRGCTGVQ